MHRNKLYTYFVNDSTPDSSILANKIGFAGNYRKVT